jgi:hypothetical protein
MIIQYKGYHPIQDVMMLTTIAKTLLRSTSDTLFSHPQRSPQTIQTALKGEPEERICSFDHYSGQLILCDTAYHYARVKTNGYSQLGAVFQ